MKARLVSLCAMPALALLLIAPGSARTHEDAAETAFFRLQHAVKLPGNDPDWDYLAYDRTHRRLFIARRDAGLWVFDTARQRLLRRIASTKGAGAALLVPSLDRGFAINEDGSLTAFSLSRLTPIKRARVAADADAASFDPVTGRIAVVSADSRKISFVDPLSLKKLGTVDLETAKADGSTSDGRGSILLNQRDRNAVLKIDARTMRITAEWPIAGCTQPTAIAYDTGNRRVFVGCRGEHPVLAVLDGDSGATITTLPLGRGNDGVIYDPARKRIFATNGVDSNLVIYRQKDADHYRMEQAVTTRPQARTMAYDPDRQQVFSVAAEGALDPARPVNDGPSQFYPNFHFDGTFAVLTYAARP